VRKFAAFNLSFLILCSFFAASVHAQNLTGSDILNAAEEFRNGVHAYNRFAYLEALYSFERSRAFQPAEPIYLDWLGKASYRSGFEAAALTQWRYALDIYGRNTGTGMLLASRIETVANRRSLLPVANDTVRYVQTSRYPGKFGEIFLYRQPTSLLNVSDGSVWVVAYGSNEIVRIDVNGVVKDRRRGPLNGFDRPYDIARGIDGRLYVSEYRGGRISVLDRNGNWLSYIGSKGLGEGQLVGPQNLAVDEDGYLYVVDYGNRRISKFDPEGTFIISFGLKNAGFPGLVSPTGIVAINGKIFAADNAAKAIYMFDPNGNYLGRLAAQGLKGPESLRFLSNGSNEAILAADANRVLLIDPNSAIVRELGLAGNDKLRITCAEMDRNGNILTANFTGGEVLILTRFDDLASGLFVQVRNVIADKFPVVTVEFTVEDRMRRPIVGLDFNNFLITEGGQSVANQVFLDPGYRYNGADISILVERSEKTAALRDDLAAAARDINRALREAGNSRVVSVISADAQPRREQHANSLENALRGTGASNPRWRFDFALRLAAADLLAAAPKRSVVYLGTGQLGEFTSDQYGGLSEHASYLANNGIVFNAIIVGGGQITNEIEYLCNETGGRAVQLYRPQGIGPLIKSIADIPSPLYSISFTSRLPTDFGRAWLPLEVEVYLMERSGRDSTGYFSPLE